MHRRLVRSIVLVAAAVAFPGVAHASEPVSRSAVGCVKAGILWSESYGRAYPMRVRSDVRQAELSLARYEGKRVRIARGLLLPGDTYIAQSVPVVIGRCRT